MSINCINIKDENKKYLYDLECFIDSIIYSFDGLFKSSQIFKSCIINYINKYNHEVYSDISGNQLETLKTSYDTLIKSYYDNIKEYLDIISVKKDCIYFKPILSKEEEFLSRPIYLIYRSKSNIIMNKELTRIDNVSTNTGFNSVTICINELNYNFNYSNTFQNFKDCDTINTEIELYIESLYAIEKAIKKNIKILNDAKNLINEYKKTILV